MTEEEKNLWEGYDPNKEIEEPDPEKLAQIAKEDSKGMHLVQEVIPRWYYFKQFVAIVYFLINLGFMYVSLSSRAVGYIAVYMIPLTLILVDYFLVIAQLKQAIKGEKK